MIRNRIFKILDANINYTEFGLFKCLETKKTLFVLNILLHKGLNVNLDLHEGFICDNKTFRNFCKNKTSGTSRTYELF